MRHTRLALQRPVTTLMITLAVLAVGLIFFIGPNVRQRFTWILPGAALGVGVWMATSYGLGLYFQHYANLNKTYGTLGAAMALLVWLRARSSSTCPRRTSVVITAEASK